jgi:hypothetical protein
MISQCQQKCYLGYRNLLITDEMTSWLGIKIMVENPQTSHNMTHSGTERKGLGRGRGVTICTFQAHKRGVLQYCTKDYWISRDIMF